MPHRTRAARYEALALSELAAASAIPGTVAQKLHLNSASVYATLAEQARGEHPNPLPG